MDRSSGHLSVISACLFYASSGYAGPAQGNVCKFAMALILIFTPRIQALIERKNAAFSSHEMRSQVHVT
jgi:hypothetical protein